MIACSRCDGSMKNVLEYTKKLGNKRTINAL